MVAKPLFWGSIGALVWAHLGYPVFAECLGRLRPLPVSKADNEPRVALIVAAHDEEAVIARRLENLLALDYPADKVEIVVVSDASTDATDQLVQAVAARTSRVNLLSLPERAGKVASQDAGVRETRGEILAFSDANTMWRQDALRKLVRSFGDRDVAYVCGAHHYETTDGTNREGLYARFEGRLRLSESRFGSITAGVGPIYAVRRRDYIELDPRLGHDLALPYRLVQRGRRVVVEPEAVAWERPAHDIADEYRRKIRMFEHCWLILLRGRMLSNVGPTYAFQLISHRYLRYASGLLHAALLLSTLRLARGGSVYRVALAGQGTLLVVAAARSGVARYYVVVTWATVPALINYLRRGVPPAWEKAAGTR